MKRSCRASALQADGGYILATVLLISALVLAAGVAVLARMRTETRLTHRHQDMARAEYAARAGLEHCLGYLMWDLEENLQGVLPGETICQQHATLGETPYDAEAVMQSEAEIKVTSIGKARDDIQYTLTAILEPSQDSLAGSDIHLWIGSDLTLEGNVSITGKVYCLGDIHVNVKQPEERFSGGLYATGDITGVSDDMAHAHLPPLSPPDFQVLDKKQKAEADGTKMPYGETLTCPAGKRSPYSEFCESDPNGDERVVWVQGNLTFQGDVAFHGSVTYIVDGTVTVKGNSVLTAESGDLTIISLAQGKNKQPAITISGNPDVQGNLVALNGPLKLNGHPTLEGILYANSLNMVGGSSFTARSAIPNADGETGETRAPYHFDITKLWQE